MNIKGAKILVLGGWGLVGMAVIRELLERHPEEIILHSLREEEAIDACKEIASEAGETRIVPSHGNILGLTGDVTRMEQLHAELKSLKDEDLQRFWLYKLLVDEKPDIVVDCVNTSTAIAYRNVFGAIDGRSG